MLAAAGCGVAGWWAMPVSGNSAPGPGNKAVQRDRPAWMGQPARTLERIHHLPAGVERDSAVLKLLASATPEELKTLILDPGSRLHERSGAMKRWAELEPQSCFDWYRELSPGELKRVGGYDDLTAVLFRTWAEKDSDAALRAARAVAHRGEFSSAQWEVISGVMRTDLTKGLKLAFDPNVPVPDNSRLTASLWEKDPAGFLKAAGELLSSGVDNRFLEEGRTKALKLWHQQDPGAAWAAVVALPRRDRTRMLPQLVELTMNDEGVEKAAALLTTVPEGDARINSSRKLLDTWAARDPDAAVKWMEQNVGSGKSEAMQRIIVAAAETQPEKALQLVSGLEAGPMRDRAMAGLADGVRDEGGKAAPVLAWLLNQPSDEGRRAALGKLSSAWVEESPEQADAFLKSAPPGGVPEGLAGDLARWHFSKGADSALKWALTLGDRERVQAVSSVVYRSAVSGNVDQTMGLLRALPAGDSREQALQAVLYGSLREEENPGTMAAALPTDLKEEAARQVRGWSEDIRGRAELLKALGQ